MEQSSRLIYPKLNPTWNSERPSGSVIIIIYDLLSSRLLLELRVWGGFNQTLVFVMFMTIVKVYFGHLQTLQVIRILSHLALAGPELTL